MKNFKSLVTTKSVGVVAGLAAVVASAALVSVGSTAAFSGSTNNDGNNWEAGRVELTNSHASALFSDTDIKPGYFGAKCIKVSTNASTPTDVTMFSGEESVVSPLTDNLKMWVFQGTGDAADCSDFQAVGADTPFDGTVSDFINNKTSFETGVVGTNSHMAAGGSVTYKIQVVLPQAAPNALQGTLGEIAFNWENR